MVFKTLMQIKEQNQNFQELIKQHKGILIKVARIYCQDEEDRQDLIQEIMIQIWKSLHKYNSKFKISTWLYRISINVAISFYRKNTVRKKITFLLTNKFHTFKMMIRMKNENN